MSEQSHFQEEGAYVGAGGSLLVAFAIAGIVSLG